MVFQNLKPLPYSGRRYMVSEDANIFDCYGNPLEKQKEDGVEYIEIEWVLGKKPYEKGLLILAAFEKEPIPDFLIDRVKIIHLDGDKTNSFPSNLFYVYSGTPIESTVPGYYLIPSFSNYAISRSGELLNLVTNKIKTWSTQKGESLGSRLPGYQYSILYTTTHTSKTVYQHRLLCLVFKEIPDKLGKLTVNHIDGNKRNNCLENLEWATYSENNVHAWQSGLRLNNRDSLLMWNLLTGEIKRFNTPSDCARHLGDASRFYISQRLRDQSGKLYPDYLLFKMDDGTEWPTVDWESVPKECGADSGNIVSRNVFTGDVTIFKDIRDVEQLPGITTAIALDHARNNKVLPYKGYNFRFFVNASSWPKHTKRHLEIYRDVPVDPKDGVVMTDKSTGEETFFTSIGKCMRAVGIERAHLNTLIFSGRLFKKRFAFKSFKLRDELI